MAAFGLWVIWSMYSQLSMLAWQYDHVASAGSGAVRDQPDYELTTLPWRTAHPRQFDVKNRRISLVTDDGPFTYQVFATIDRNGAKAAAFHFDVTIESGGATIGLLQDGKWIASNSSQAPGRFVDSNSTLLGSGRSLTFVIANNNPAGESRLTVDDLRLYLRR